MILPQISIAYQGVEEDRMPEAETLCINSVRAGIEAAALRFPEGAELSILFADDATLRDLNRRWRDLDKPTNVLSFPGEDIGVGDMAGPVLGDIAISLDTMEREAALEKKGSDAHLCHLVIHGFFHLFGYDHQTEQEAELMEGLEAKALASLGFSNPYAILDPS